MRQSVVLLWAGALTVLLPCGRVARAGDGPAERNLDLPSVCEAVLEGEWRKLVGNGTYWARCDSLLSEPANGGFQRAQPEGEGHAAG